MASLDKLLHPPKPILILVHGHSDRHIYAASQRKSKSWGEFL